MQLVYAWIKNYNNIHEQGFNFGSNYFYTSSYIEVDNSLTISRKKNNLYCEKFYSKNVNGYIDNITAIVGDNGSGKSSLMKILRRDLPVLYSFPFPDADILHDDIVFVFENQGKIIIRKGSDLTVNTSFPYRNFSSKRSDHAETIYYSPHLEFNSFDFLWMNFDIDVSLTSEIKSFSEKDQGIPFIQKMYYDNTLQQIKFLTKIQNKNWVNDNIKFPLKLRLIINDFEDKKKKNYIPNDILERFKQRIDFLYPKIINPYPLFNEPYLHFLRSLIVSITHQINSAITIEDLTNDKTISTIEGLAIKLITLQTDYNQEAVTKFIYAFKAVEANIKTENQNGYYLDFQHGQFLINEYLKVKKDSLKNTEDNHPFPDILDFSWLGISSGEYYFLSLFSKLNQAIEDIKSKFLKEFRLPLFCYLLLDEADLGLHLQWQKEFIQNILFCLDFLLNIEIDSLKFNPNVQIIFTTHSPVTLSDIPSSNVVYLKKGADGKCKVLQNESKPRHSFAANIHELITDSFYLKDGVIGNFAKTKIQEVIEWCENKENSNDSERMLKTINIIDEPLIKMKLLELYWNKMGAEQREIILLEEQKKIIDARLKMLNKKSDDSN